MKKKARRKVNRDAFAVNEIAQKLVAKGRVMAIEGYVVRSNGGRVRLYRDLSMSLYFEIDERDVLEGVRRATEYGDRTRVWLSATSPITVAFVQNSVSTDSSETRRLVVYREDGRQVAQRQGSKDDRNCAERERDINQLDRWIAEEADWQMIELLCALRTVEIDNYYKAGCQGPFSENQRCSRDYS